MEYSEGNVSTLNGSLVTDPQQYEEPKCCVPGIERYIVPAIFYLIVMLGCTGNVLVILVVIKNKDVFRNTTNLFILNLAVADLFFLIFCVPFHANIHHMQHWIFGEFMCKFVHLVQYIGMMASILTLVAMALDRFLAVGYPLSTKHIRTPIVALVISVLIWLISLGIAVPMFVVYTVHFYPKHDVTVCADHWKPYSHRRIYFLCLFLLGYAIPLLAISILSSLLIRQLWALPGTEGPGLRGSIRAKRKVTRLVIVVVCVFFACWLPTHAIWLSVNWNPDAWLHYTYPLYYSRMLAHIFSYANSAMNPIIYAFLSTQFRKGFHRALHCPLREARSTYTSGQHYSSKYRHSMASHVNGRVGSSRVSFAGLMERRTSITNATDTSVWNYWKQWSSTVDLYFEIMASIQCVLQIGGEEFLLLNQDWLAQIKLEVNKASDISSWGCDNIDDTSYRSHILVKAGSIFVNRWTCIFKTTTLNMTGPENNHP